ncbi:MAG: hypothetical protein V4437_01695 [Patescibacteria group bacterium]
MKYGRLGVFLVAGFLLTSPLFAHADTALSGGFPSGALWFSKTPLVEKTPVKIFTPVYNSSTEKVIADAVFTLDGTPLGTAHFEIAGGESQIVSILWTPVIGTHKVAAHIENAHGTDGTKPISLSEINTTLIDIDVAPAPPQSALIQALGGATTLVGAITSVALPVVESAAGTVFKETESLRQGVVESLQNSLGVQNDIAPSEGKVLGAETYRAPKSALTAAASTGATSSGVMRMLQQVLLFIVSYTWIFYPLLLIVLLLLLFLIGKAAGKNRSPKRV